MLRPRQGRLAGDRGGFTLIELVIVILIAGILMAYAIPQLNGARGKRTARNARDVFVWTVQRARAAAIQTGSTQLLQINPANEKVWVVKEFGSLPADTLVSINFQRQYETMLSTGSNSLITICFSPRGYATRWGSDCGTLTGGQTADITFTHASYTSAARIRPLGQAEKL